MDNNIYNEYNMQKNDNNTNIISNNNVNNVNNDNQVYINPEPNQKNNKKQKVLKRVTTITGFLIALSLVGFGLVYTGVIKINYVEPKSITINSGNLAIKSGREYQLLSQVYPEKTSDKNVVYVSSDPSILEVNEVTGAIVGHKAGVAHVTIKLKDSNTIIDSAEVLVVEKTSDLVPTEKIILSYEKLVFDVSYSSKKLIKVSTEPSNSSDIKFDFKSGDEGVATVDEYGYVQAVGYGKTKIIVSTKDGSVKATCDVIVTDSKNQKVYFESTNNEKIIFPYAIVLEEEYIRLKPETERTIGFTLLPPEVTEDVVTWQSSDATIASVKDGVVTGKKLGIATITAMTVNDLVATLKVEVTNEELEITELDVREKEIYLNVGSKESVSLKYDSDATLTDFKYSSNDITVATVNDEGVIEAIGEGETDIIITTSNGLETKVTVIVTKTSTEDDVVDSENKNLNIDQTIEYDTTNLNGESLTGNYTTDDNSVAGIDENGVLYGKSAGTTNLYYTDSDGNTTVSSINVSEVLPTKLEIQCPETVNLADSSNEMVYALEPNNVTNKQIKWTYSEEGIVEIDEQNYLKPSKEGTVTITATSLADETKTATCDIKITKDIVEETNVTYSQSKSSSSSSTNTNESNEEENNTSNNITDLSFYSNKSYGCKDNQYMENENDFESNLKNSKAGDTVKYTCIDSSTGQTTIYEGTKMADIYTDFYVEPRTVDAGTSISTNSLKMSVKVNGVTDCNVSGDNVKIIKVDGKGISYSGNQINIAKDAGSTATVWLKYLKGDLEKSFTITINKSNITYSDLKVSDVTLNGIETKNLTISVLEDGVTKSNPDVYFIYYDTASKTIKNNQVSSRDVKETKTERVMAYLKNNPKVNAEFTVTVNPSYKDFKVSVVNNPVFSGQRLGLTATIFRNGTTQNIPLNDLIINLSGCKGAEYSSNSITFSNTESKSCALNVTYKAPNGEKFEKSLNITLSNEKVDFTVNDITLNPGDCKSVVPKATNKDSATVVVGAISIDDTTNFYKYGDQICAKDNITSKKTTKATIKNTQGITKEFKVSVNPWSKLNISISKSSNLKIGDKLNITASLSTDTGLVKNLNCSEVIATSDSLGIVNINDGNICNITAASIGTTNLTFRLKADKTIFTPNSKSINVIADEKKAGISLSQSYIIRKRNWIGVMTSTDIIATITNVDVSDAKNYTIETTSGSICSVAQSGEILNYSISAKKEGPCRIHLMHNGDKIYTKLIPVTSDYEIERIIVSGKRNLKKGDNINLSVTGYIKGIPMKIDSDTRLKLTSDNSKLVRINGTNITILDDETKQTTVVITATYKNDNGKNVSGTATLTINPKNPKYTIISFTNKTSTISKGSTYKFRARLCDENGICIYDNTRVSYNVTGSVASISKDGVLSVPGNVSKSTKCTVSARIKETGTKVTQVVTINPTSSTSTSTSKTYTCYVYNLKKTNKQCVGKREKIGDHCYISVILSSSKKCPSGYTYIGKAGTKIRCGKKSDIFNSSYSKGKLIVSSRNPSSTIAYNNKITKYKCTAQCSKSTYNSRKCSRQ